MEQQLIVSYSIKYGNYLRSVRNRQIDRNLIASEEICDAFYAVCTNLEIPAESVVKVNKRRWQIEECFRIMKTDFETWPLYVKRQDYITVLYTFNIATFTSLRFLSHCTRIFLFLNTSTSYQNYTCQSKRLSQSCNRSYMVIRRTNKDI